MTKCNLNPVIDNVYQWGDRDNTTVKIHEDGSATITQGKNIISLDCFGFFRDVTKVFDLAIDEMPESEVKNVLMFKSLGTSRSFPSVEWKDL